MLDDECQRCDTQFFGQASPNVPDSCLLRKGNVQIPSDLHGVIYTDLDATRIPGALTAKRRGLADAISPSMVSAWASHKSFRPKDGSGGLSPHCVVCYPGCRRGPGGTRLKTVMPREVKKRPVVDDKTIRVFPDHRGLHAVVENLARYAADRLERGNAAAQN